MSVPRILSIAGSDSSGGAGIQADIKTITMLGGYAMTAITAITAQNTLGVQAVEAVPDELLLQQIASCINDIGVDAVKIGMLGSASSVRTAASALAAAPAQAAARFPIVLDPVMIATSGARLADTATVDAMVEGLFPLATLLTPNLPELAALTGALLGTPEDIVAAGQALARAHKFHLLVKGGHGTGETVVDLLFAPGGTFQEFAAPRIPTRHTHGTGCTLSSAIATFLGMGLPLADAVEQGRQFVRAALVAAPGFGAGSGPLGHHAVR
ncbi:MAG: bifunctional hydroxymethylpyrimidine kinase/phosphomethylpyrimidine kinase [Novosphingobium sp.]